VARQVKCPYCEIKLDKDEAYEYKKRYYHANCFETWRSEVEQRKELLDYICKLYSIDAPTGMMTKQIKDYQQEYNYKLKGMELALRYFYETLDNKVREGDGIGIIPFVYEEAKNHYVKQMKISESLSNIKKNEEITVFIDTSRDKRKTKKIDIAAI
jgi:molybdopterin converting factor small subunit